MYYQTLVKNLFNDMYHYLMEKAWELVEEETKKQRINVGFAVEGDTVLNWVDEYYALNDQEQVEKKEKEAQEKFLAKMSPAKGTEKQAVILS